MERKKPDKSSKKKKVEKVELVDKTEKKKSGYNFFINDNLKNEPLDIKDNVIDQSKYSIITFLPKALLYQFYRLANDYFLIIAILQSIPAISPLSPLTAIAPIAFVISVSLIREAIEDYSRHQFDNQLNSEPVIVFKDNQWKQSQSGELLVGELVLVKQDDPFPADLILLDSSLPEGACFIETGSLDGEKNLKNKIANKITHSCVTLEKGDELLNATVSNIQGRIECDSPNPELYKFDGALEISIPDKDIKDERVSLDAKQMLLKGAILRNTEWILGFVVYTGHNTKLILNSKAPRQKLSRMENLMTNLLLFILALQSVFCIVCAVSHSIYNNIHAEKANYLTNKSGYLPPPYGDSNAVDSTLCYFTYILLLNTMIPISLIITLEITKVIQGYFISVDCELFSHIRLRFCKAGSVSLNEELGQVNYIFSDKTGTLTCNKMGFKYCVLGDTCYEYNKLLNDPNSQESEIEKEKRASIREQLGIIEVGPGYAVKYVNNKSNTAKDTLYYTIASNQNSDVFIRLTNDREIFHEYWKALSLAHECSVEEKEKPIAGTVDVRIEGQAMDILDSPIESEKLKIKSKKKRHHSEESNRALINKKVTSVYTGLSPDDIELLNACKDQGYEYINSGSSVKRSVIINGTKKDFQVLNINEFNSDRKRMSIILKDGDMIKLYMKGADTEMIKKLSDKSSPVFFETAKRYVDYFSQYGYRTLLVGMKVLDPKEYANWSKKLADANYDIKNKAKLVDEAMSEIEMGCYLLGATVVEDKLQDQVPECIRDLRLAGIKIWMLTGDKFNTAYNIGLSCNLISNSLHIFTVKGEEKEDVNTLVKKFKEFEKRQAGSEERKFYGIVIDSVALTDLLKDPNKTKAFLDIAHEAESVICCRVSPLQKAEVVRSMKEYNPLAVTLSIGDGGNDVSMIMEAHIGVGVYGEEGMRAVQASDYAIGEFKFLRRLLLWHGRTNNVRIAEMIHYFFYKNFVFTLVHFFFAFLSLASGQTIIDDWLITFYNLLFTAFPLGARACLDKDVSQEDGKIIYELMPFMYKENRENQIFNVKSFLLSLLRGCVHGIINFVFVIYVYWQHPQDSNGNDADLWIISLVLFTNIIFTVSFRLLTVQKTWTIYNISVMLILSWLAYFLFLWYIGSSDIFNSYGIMGIAFGSPRLYLVLVSVAGTNFLIDLATYSYHTLFMKNLTQNLMILVKQNGKIEDATILPDDIQSYYDKFLFAVEDSPEKQNKTKSKKKGKTTANTKNLEKIDRVSPGEMESVVSNRGEDEESSVKKSPSKTVTKVKKDLLKLKSGYKKI